ncbi:UNVERIFIED_ORG: poly(hydroxyalkanoate) depolymerase family esterase [Rhizobium etli]
MAAKPPLVVILHGCRQTPEGFDAASGFSALARQCGFVLLYPQQSEGNNPQRCFNWFRPSAVARDRGELMSVRQMIEFACSRHRIDRSRIYIAGLSAGGALTSALVATYPGLFAGAALFAGMPLGAARDAMSALRAMKSGVARSPGDWGDLVRTVSPDQKRWPPISIWHGTDDRVVNASNARASVSQWLAVGGINEDAGRTTLKPWGELTQWKSKHGIQVSFYSLKGFGHGLPVRRSARERQTARFDPYIVDAGISAPLTLVRTWGLKR